MKRWHRQHTREFKLAALARMDIAPDVRALARELGIERALLYRWQRHRFCQDSRQTYSRWAASL